MKNDFVLTSTPTIEGCAIKKYIDVVNINIVLGTNFFSDFGASFTDLFGGQSDTYESKLVKMYGLAKEKIIEEANSRQANAAVNFSVDFDEISGKNKSMFMLTATATVVVADLTHYESVEHEDAKITRIITCEKLSLEVRKRKIRAYTSQGECLKAVDLKFLIQHPIDEFVDALIYTYGQYTSEEDMADVLTCLSRLDKNLIADKLYRFYADKKENGIRRFIMDHNLLDTAIFLRVLQEYAGNFEAQSILIGLLKADSDTYVHEDVENMVQILDVYKALPDKGSIQTVKGGLTRKEKEVYVCPNGHKNDKDTVYCSTCLMNIKGLTQNQGLVLEGFQDKLDALRDLFEGE